MDQFAQRPAEELAVFFQEAAVQDTRIPAALMEKDFWVCWVLRRLFSLAHIAEHLTFKGGTCLSKVHKAIHRFSEDIDLAISRDSLGFGGDESPELEASGKKTQQKIGALKSAAQDLIVEQLKPQLTEAIRQLLPKDTWELTTDQEDADGQTLLFKYPQATASSSAPYFPSHVKIELGARSDAYPTSSAIITPYVADMFPQLVPDATVNVKAQDAERTFWEKAVIAHAIHHRPAEKPLRPRQSRHFYDLFMLCQAPVRDAALKQLPLLRRVAQHHEIYFKAGWAKYDEAIPPTLKLIPNETRRAELREDYKQMQSMLFGDAPDFERILEALADLEIETNRMAD